MWQSGRWVLLVCVSSELARALAVGDCGPVSDSLLVSHTTHTSRGALQNIISQVKLHPSHEI